MKIKTIGCSGTYEVGRPAFKKYWMEAELEESENEIEAMDTLNQKIEDLNKKYNPEPEKKSILPQKPQSKESVEIQAVLDGINAAKDLPELETFWLKSKNNLSLSQPYQDKLKLLRDAK